MSSYSIRSTSCFCTVRATFPFGRYNPLEWIDRHDRELVDEMAFLADAVVAKEQNEVHFTESAKTYLKAILLWMMAGGDEDGDLDLVRLRELAMRGHEGRGIEPFLALLSTSKLLDGAIARPASMLSAMGDRERGSVISTVGRNTDFLDSAAMANLTGVSSFDPRRIKEEPTTIYLVLPEWRMASHHRWMRLVIASLLAHLQRAPTRPDRPRTLMMLDEFPALGEMVSLERAASYIAGFGVRMVFCVQDLSQLKAIYGGERWQTFVANAGAVIAYSNSDPMTVEYLSKRCGETEVLKVKRSAQTSDSSSRTYGGLFARIESLLKGQGLSGLGASSQNASRGQTSQLNPEMVSGPLVTADEISIHFARETGTALVLINGARPMRIDRIQYWDDPLFGKLAARSPFHTAPPRAPA